MKVRGSARRLSLAALCFGLLAARSPTSPDDTMPSPFAGAEYTLGSASAPVTVVEYLSDTCSHCAAFNSDTYPGILADYIEPGKIRMIIRELPTAPLVVAAAGFLFARCLGPDGYWPAVRKLLEQQAYVLAGKDQAEELARAANVTGLSEAQAHTCLADEAALMALNDRRQGAIDAGADSTPTFIFNGERLQSGSKLGGITYEGGELSRKQFDGAYRRALKRMQVSSGSPPRRPDRSSRTCRGKLRRSPPTSTGQKPRDPPFGVRPE